MQNHKKNILIFIDWFLPGTNSGGPVRSYANMIDHLGDSFNFYIITRNVDYCSTEVYNDINSNNWNQLNENTRVYYFSDDHLRIKNIKNLIRKTNFDIAYINGIYSWYFSILPLLLLKRSTRIIVSARGMLNPQAFTSKKLKKKVYLKVAKSLGLFQKVIFQATNGDEEIFVKKEIGRNVQVVVAPNFPRKIHGFENKSVQKTPGEIRLINVARISKEKGTLYLIELFLQFHHGNIELDLYGPIYDTEYWEQCKTAIFKLPKNVQVTYKGILKSEEVPSTLVSYHFFIMTTEGENFGHSILEALSVGLPVIISDQTPWRNLSLKKVGWDISMKDKKYFHKVLIQTVEMDQKQYQEYSNCASAYAQEIINDPNIYSTYELLFLENIPLADSRENEETALSKEEAYED